MNCSPPGSSVHGILQAGILEWVAIPFSRGISPTHGSHTGLLHCGQILHHLSHRGSPLAPPTRDQTHAPCISRQVLNHWTTREVPVLTFGIQERHKFSAGREIPFWSQIRKGFVKGAAAETDLKAWGQGLEVWTVKAKAELLQMEAAAM